MKLSERELLEKKQIKELDRIIANKRVYPVFQPIVDLRNGEIHGYEALSRIITPDCISNPEELFDIAMGQGRTWELEKLCRKKIISRYAKFEQNMKNGKLFINVNPMVMMDESFKANFTRKQLEKYGISPEKIVIEITERNAVDNIEEFIEAIQHYKKEGYQIAIDDIGACYSGLNVVCNTHPHYLKVDIQLIRDIDKDQMKYALVKGLVEIAIYASICILAEGIETEEELETLLDLGVMYGQGYFLGRPDCNLADTRKDAKKVIRKYRDNKNYLNITYKEYKIVSIAMKDYRSYEEYAKKYGDERASEISEMLFETVGNVLHTSDLMKVVSETKCIVILEKSRCNEVLEQISEQFNNAIISFYDDETINRGYTERITKKGKIKTVPLLKLEMDEDIL
ncbi:MAG: EAL domain-containing protein [Lachnospiraceae bacterium]